MTLQQRRFRFGVQLATATSAADWTAQVRRADKLGYDSVLIPDHLGLLAYGPAISMAAGVSARLRFGTLVLQHPLRHPVLVAMEAATLDLLTDGRFELGLGAGGSELRDYMASGIPFALAATRVGQFEEGVQIIKRLLGQEPVTFHGAHYSITDLDGQPKPVQQPHLPILIGAGAPRMLRLAAREADIVSMLLRMLPGGGAFDVTEFSAEAYRRKLDIVRASAGDRAADLEFNVLVQRFAITNDPAKEAASISERWGISVDDILDSPYVLIGTPEQIIEVIQERRERFGLSYYVVFDRWIDDFVPIVRALSGQ